MEPVRHTAHLAAGPIDYATLGEGRPLLVLHPAGGVRWSAPLRALAQSFRLYVPIAPGFDGTAANAAIGSIRDLAQTYGEFIDRTIGAKCDLIGHSFGGWVAAWLAVFRPARIERLVLECAAGFRPHDAGPAPADPVARHRAMFRHPERLVGEQKSAAMEAANRDAYARYHGGVTFDEALVARLPEIDAPTLILQGRHDGIVLEASAQLLRGRIRRAELVHIEDAAHVIEVDQPERMLAVTRVFLARAANAGGVSRSARSAGTPDGPRIPGA